MMRAVMKTTFAAAALAGLVHAWPGAQAQPPSRQPVTAAQYEQWKKQLSNWGRWGAADEIGTMNLRSGAKRRVWCETASRCRSRRTPTPSRR